MVLILSVSTVEDEIDVKTVVVEVRYASTTKEEAPVWYVAVVRFVSTKGNETDVWIVVEVKYVCIKNLKHIVENVVVASFVSTIWKNEIVLTVVGIELVNQTKNHTKQVVEQEATENSMVFVATVL